MDKSTPPLRVFLFSQPQLATEWLSLLGDKYAHALNFSWEITDDFSVADVIAWDGIMTAKLKYYQERLISKLEKGTILLLQDDMRTLLETHPFVQLVSLDQLRYVEVPGWSTLPEDLLQALVNCHQKWVTRV